MEVFQWLKNTQYWLLPGFCVVCNKPSGLPRDLCSACLLRFSRIERPCQSCALPLPAGTHDAPHCGRCLGRSRRMARTLAAFAYTEPLTDLVAGFKYRGALPHGRVLGELLLERLHREYVASALPDLLLPVPLHPRRLRERGFNQALVLARQLGSALRIPVADSALLRDRHTPAQQGLSAKERKHNLRGAFTLQADLAGVRALALIDDVVTTMSTMHEIARVLWRAQPELELHAWCLARA